MKKLFVLIFLALLIIPSLVLADGMPFPRRYYEKTFDFTSLKEKQQYAVIEILSNYFEKMNLYLSLTSLDYEDHNITVVIPLRSTPQDVSGDKLNSSDFLKKYNFADIEGIIEKQSLGGLVKKTSPQVRDALGEYIMLSLISPLYEISKLAFYPIYGGFMGTSALPSVMKETQGVYPGVTLIATYEFEGATVDIYDVMSGETLEDFVRDYYDLYLPSNVKEAIDTYKTHYIAILNAMVGPPSDVSLLKQYAPETFNDALKYVRTNPEVTFTCYGGYQYPYYPTGESIAVPPYYGTCSEQQAISQKFSNFINLAKIEVSKAPINISLNSLPISNPGFEQGNAFWQNYGGGYYYPRTNETGYSIDYSTYGTAWGSTSLYVFDRSASDWVGLCQQVSVIPGRNYTASVWAKAEQGNLLFWLTTNYPNTGGSLGECTYPQRDFYISSRDWREYSFSCKPQYSRTMYICLGTGYAYNTGSGWFDDVKLYYDDRGGSVEKAMIDFFMNAYSNSTKGMEISFTLPIRNNEIFYPLGTGIAWSTPIEDTKIMAKMDRSLDVSFQNVQSSVIDSNKRYYLWNYKNWNPDFDIKGTVATANFLTTLGDTGKSITQSMYENSAIVSIFVMIIIVIIAGIIVRYRGRGDIKRKTFFIILTILFAPLISIWVIVLLAFGLKTKTEKGELKENMMNVLIFLGVLILAWIFMAVISIIIGG